MACSEAGCPQGSGFVEQHPKFDQRVADKTGIGCFASLVGGAKIIDYQTMKFRPQVDNLNRDIQLGHHGCEMIGRIALEYFRIQQSRSGHVWLWVRGFKTRYKMEADELCYGANKKRKIATRRQPANQCRR